MKGYETCYGHRPDLAEERKRNAARGGRSGGRGRGSGELTSIKAQLAQMLDTVLSGVVPTAPYAVGNQILNTLLRAIEIERKIKETDQLEARLEELERAAGEQPKGERRWNA
jgi:hypothetical protein